MNFEVLALIIEIVSGIPFDEFLKTEIFMPLKMEETSFFVASEEAYRVMPCYESTSGFGTKLCASEVRYNVTDEPRMKGGGAGLIASVGDLTTFARCLCNRTEYEAGKRLLSENAFTLMTSNALVNSETGEQSTLVEMAFSNTFSESVGEGIGFGLGVSVVCNPEKVKGGSLSSKGEFGWGGVASTWMMIDPDQKLLVVFATQLVPSSKLPIRSQLRWLAHHLTKE